MDHRDNAASERTAVGTTEALAEGTVELSKVMEEQGAAKIAVRTDFPTSRGLG
jgi:hypothetical protein